VSDSYISGPICGRRREREASRHVAASAWQRICKKHWP